jgi:hypothetical protein
MVRPLDTWVLQAGMYRLFELVMLRFEQQWKGARLELRSLLFGKCDFAWQIFLEFECSPSLKLQSMPSCELRFSVEDLP